MLVNDIDLNIARIDDNFDDWLYDNLIHQEAASKAAITGAIKWKASIIDNLKGYVAQFANYVNQQTANDVQFLQQNQPLIKNTKQYPVKSENSMQQAPNYVAAIQRLNAPISTHLLGTDLNRIEEESSENPRTNIQFKKSMIPNFNGQQQFSVFAKQYYYGAEANKQNLNPAQTAVLMQTGYQFCFTFKNRINSIQADLNGIINFINKDPFTGAPNQQNPEAELNTQQNNQNTPAAQTKASTNPNNNTNNTVNASYELFMSEYFGDNWEALCEADNDYGYKSINQQQTPTDTTTNKDVQDMAKADKQPSGVPVNNNALLQKKKQIACDIVKTAFAAKLSALGLVYRDLMHLMRRHVASYRGPEAANQGNNNQGGM